MKNKPIFLSIGYSTCHWCHVMERESFENDQIAELLNRDYVSIKVDREERPDVDRIYMTFVQATTGGGGWPMSVWLTPDLQPFFGGTYFPPENRFGHPGFASILTQIAKAWQNDRDKIVESAREVVEQLQKQTTVEPGRRRSDRRGRDGFGLSDLPPHVRFAAWAASAALRNFRGPTVYNFLLRYYARTKNQEALDMVLLTLREMAKGGMNDQLGGGFHRYSVDERWFVPHFEKMLYDQAQLAISYLEAFQITKDQQYADTARRMLDYVLRDMTAPEGGFYSAEDADSVIDPEDPKVKGEGAFYIWDAERNSRAGRRGRRPIGSAIAMAWRDAGNVANDPHQRVHQPQHPVPGRDAGGDGAAVWADRGRGSRRHRRRIADASGGAGAARAAASRRQGPDLVERPDDLGLRARRRGAATSRAMPVRPGARRSFVISRHVRSASAKLFRRYRAGRGRRFRASWTITRCSPRH